jgi:hypothetical protein
MSHDFPRVKNTVPRCGAATGTVSSSLAEDLRICLTGAMRPERFVDTDAHFNLGAAGKNHMAMEIIPSGYVT